LKSALIEESFYFGDDQVEVLCSLKSKEELIGDIIALLQSPAKNLISSLQSGGNKLSGIISALKEKSGNDPVDNKLKLEESKVEDTSVDELVVEDATEVQLDETKIKEDATEETKQEQEGNKE
jgi:hypothetical protein